MKVKYDETYYRNNYVNPFYVFLKLADLYYLWLAYFCIIIPAKLKKGSRVLDVGCGIGNLVWALRFFGINAYGVDPSISAKKFCRVPKFCNYGENMKSLYKKPSFDLAYSSEVLEHIREEDLNDLIFKMDKLTKNIIIQMIGVKERGRMVTEDQTHLTVKSEKWWENKFKKLGYKIKKGNLFYFFPHIFSPKIRITGIKSGYFFLSKK